MTVLMAPKPTNWRGMGDFPSFKPNVTCGLLCESPDIAATVAEDVSAVHNISAYAAPLSADIDIVDKGWDILFLQCDAHFDIALQLLEALAKLPLISRPAVILQISIEALDELFPVAEMLEADILIGNDRAERIAALLGTKQRSALAEQDEETANMLRHLTQQMDMLARKLDSFEADVQKNDAAPFMAGRLASPEDGFRGPKDCSSWLISSGKAGHMSATDVRRIIAARRQRDKVFGEDLFADPAWDILLDLYAAFLEERQVSVSSLCIAAAVPPTTALRWLKLMTKSGWLEREADPIDRRRVYMRLSAKSLKNMQKYLDDLDLDDAALI
jgi:hypothetical protein